MELGGLMAIRAAITSPSFGLPARMTIAESPGPLLEDFLVGDSLAASPALRHSLICHCLTAHVLPPAALLRVLQRLSGDESASATVVELARQLHPDEAVRDWLKESIGDSSLPLPTRLQLLAADPAAVTPPKLLEEAAAALLAGASLPPEVLGLFDASLWVDTLRCHAHHAAAALVVRLPRAHLLSSLKQADDSPLTPFLQRGLTHPKRASRRACLDVAEVVIGGASCSLLALLSVQQPLHLISATTDLPPEWLHDAAALLAIEHGDKRVADEVICGRELRLGSQCLFGPLATAASKVMASRAVDAPTPPPWVCSWQRRVAEAWSQMEMSEAAGAVANLLERCGATGGISAAIPIVEEWVRCAQPPPAVLPLPAPRALQAIRRAAKSAASALAEKLLLSLLHGEAGQQTAAEGLPDGELATVLEVLLCAPCGAHQLPQRLLSRAACLCVTVYPPPAEQLSQLATAHPQAAAVALSSCDAGTALWAAASLHGVAVLSGHDGFALSLDGGATFGATSWLDARAACEATPWLAAAYPRTDPEYSSIRGDALLALGPAAAAHATPVDAELFVR